MHDNPFDPVDSSEPFAKPWLPSPRLQARLWMAVWAMLLAGGLLAAGAAAALAQGPVQGFTPAHGLAWAAFVPLWLVLRTYLDLARETESVGLQKSALGLFWVGVFLQALALAGQKVLPWGWEVTLVVAVALGLLAVLAYLGSPSAGATGKPPQATVPPAEAASAPAEATPGATAASKVGIVASLAVGLFVLVKVLAKGGLFAKFVAVKFIGRMIKNLSLDTVAAVEGVILVLCAAGFLVWFGAAKVRQRGPLGRPAAVVGWLEILTPVLFGLILAGWLLFAFQPALEQPGVADKDLAKLWIQLEGTLLAVALQVSLFWALLTALLFRSLQGRFAPGGG